MYGNCFLILADTEQRVSEAKATSGNISDAFNGTCIVCDVDTESVFHIKKYINNAEQAELLKVDGEKIVGPISYASLIYFRYSDGPNPDFDKDFYSFGSIERQRIRNALKYWEGSPLECLAEAVGAYFSSAESKSQNREKSLVTAGAEATVREVMLARMKADRIAEQKKESDGRRLDYSKGGGAGHEVSNGRATGASIHGRIYSLAIKGMPMRRARMAVLARRTAKLD